MFRLQLARCLAQKGNHALRQQFTATGLVYTAMRSTAIAAQSLPGRRGLATVAPNEPPVSSLSLTSDEARQQIRFFRVMQGITSMKCTLHGEKTPRACTSLGIPSSRLSILIMRQAYFANMSDPSKSPRTAFQPPPTLIPTPAGGAPSLIPGDSQGVDNDVTDHLKVQLLVRAYQVRGHHKANMDPLGIKSSATFDYRTA